MVAAAESGSNADGAAALVAYTVGGDGLGEHVAELAAALLLRRETYPSGNTENQKGQLALPQLPAKTIY